MIRKLVILAAVVMLPCVAQAASWQIPANCGSCAAQTPLPDDGTASLLNAFGNPKAANYIGPNKYAPGDTVTICNSAGCATYTISANGLYQSGTWTNGADHTPPRPGGSGGGGSGSGGGGLAGGGSGIGDPTPPDGDGCPGCNPTVTVGAG